MLGKRTPNRKMWPGVWDLIGGHCEGEETPEETLVREVNEEIGVTPINFTQFAAINDSIVGGPDGYPCLVFLVREWTGTPRNMQLHEHSEIRWFPITESLNVDLAHPDYPTIFRTIAFCRSMIGSKHFPQPVLDGCG